MRSSHRVHLHDQIFDLEFPGWQKFHYWDDKEQKHMTLSGAMCIAGELSESDDGDSMILTVHYDITKSGKPKEV
jgi:hypothetical protein